MTTRHDLDCLAVIGVELDQLATALEVVRVVLATVAHQVHLLQLTHDPARETCPNLTHHNGSLVNRYTRGGRNDVA